jgi:hypothetical protein
MAVEQAIDKVQIPGTTTAGANGYFSGNCGVGSGCECRYLFVPRVQPFNTAVASHRIGKSIKTVTYDAVDAPNTGG